MISTCTKKGGRRPPPSYPHPLPIEGHPHLSLILPQVSHPVPTRPASSPEGLEYKVTSSHTTLLHGILLGGQPRPYLHLGTNLVRICPGGRRTRSIVSLPPLQTTLYILLVLIPLSQLDLQLSYVEPLHTPPCQSTPSCMPVDQAYL